MTNLYARYLYNILQQFITDTYIYHNISLTLICILCALMTTCQTQRTLKFATYIFFLQNMCIYTCKMNFSALHNHSLSNKQCVVDVFFDNVRVLQRYCKEITFLVHNTVSLQVDSAIVRPLSVGIEAYLFLLFCVFIVSNMLIKVSRNCRLIPQ